MIQKQQRQSLPLEAFAGVCQRARHMMNMAWRGKCYSARNYRTFYNPFVTLGPGAGRHYRRLVTFELRLKGE